MNIHKFVDLHNNADPDSFFFSPSTLSYFKDRITNMSVQQSQIETNWHKDGQHDGNSHQDSSIVIDVWRLVTGGKNSCVHYFTIDGVNIGPDEKEV